MQTFVPSVVYNAITVPFSLSMGIWESSSKGHGGQDTSGSGIPEAFEYRRDETCKIKLRFTEAEWPAIRTWLTYCQRNPGVAFTFKFQLTPTEIPAGGISVYLEEPEMGKEIKPQRGETKGTLELEIVIRSTTSTPIHVQAY